MAMTDAVSNNEMREPSPAHVYEAIMVPKTVINQEEELMDKNVAYGPVYAAASKRNYVEYKHLVLISHKSVVPQQLHSYGFYV